MPHKPYAATTLLYYKCIKDYMNRSVDDRNVLDKFCETFCNILEKHGKYIVVSGFVAIASGRTRGTEDIDVIVERLTEQKFSDLHNDLIKHGFICMQSDNPQIIYHDYLDKNVSVRYTSKETPLPEMELKFAKDVLDNYQLQTRKKIPLTDLDVWFSSIEMNIAFKEEYLKSPKDLDDAHHLRTIFKDEIDEGEINRIKEMIKKCR